MDGCWTGARRRLTAAVAAAAGFLVTPVAAFAAAPPVITDGPRITGSPQVGAELIAVATWTGDPAPVASWSWLRCPRPNGGGCQPIAGATGQRYVAQASDTGAFLRVRLRLSNSAGTADGRSQPTPPIAAAPVATPEPTASPSPSPSPTPTPTPTPTPEPVVFDSTAPASAPAGSLAPPAPAPAPAVRPLRPLRPFPVVRIKGELTETGARVSLLSVRAPTGARISVRCRGTDCPIRRYVPPPRTRRLRPFERELRAGTRLEIRVTRAGFIGKYAAIVIRRGAAPWRSDRCLQPGRSRPVECPRG